MKYIERVTIKNITIKYFRSITSLNIALERLNMFVGLNDVGKSNVLKALNLFFTGETDYGEKFDFETDFSQLFPANSKKAREIIIKITFEVPHNYKGSGNYIWEKRWREQGIVKNKITTVDNKEISPRSKIPNLLGKIKFRYVPAVKSKEYYRFLLIELYKAVSSAVDSPLKIASDKFSITLREYTEALKNLILNHIGMESELSLPDNFSEIFETLLFQTRKENSSIVVPLSQRGDGIQARHIPIILKYIADEDYKQSNSRGATKINTIWGFEEPENGLELLKAFEMADEFLLYSKEVQVFITTHSPAFYVKKEEEGVKVIFIKKSPENDGTIVITNPEREFMDDSLGLMPFIAPYIAEQNKKIQEIKQLWTMTPLVDKPTIMVEGKSDKSYLEMAIKELSEPLKNMLDKEDLRILTQEDGAGTTLIKNWVFAWLHSGNKSKMMAVFDKDEAGNTVSKEIKANSLYQTQNNKTRVKVIQLEPSKEILDLYSKKIHIPFEIEHLLCSEIWCKAIERKFVESRDLMELATAYKGQLSRDRSINDILKEKISDEPVRNTIVDYNPHKDKKMSFCKLVEESYQAKEFSNIFEGFRKTIEKIEQFFS
ncbi:MAG: ATP-dependent nuclease [Oliverpabstia sp.]